MSVKSCHIVVYRGGATVSYLLFTQDVIDLMYAPLRHPRPRGLAIKFVQLEE